MRSLIQCEYYTSNVREVLSMIKDINIEEQMFVFYYDKIEEDLVDVCWKEWKN